MTECVCEGNWREIVTENEKRIGDYYSHETHNAYTDTTNCTRWRFSGIVWAEDDFYYLMTNAGGSAWLSCVGSIAAHGYEWVECGHYWMREPDGKEKCVKCAEEKHEHSA